MVWDWNTRGGFIFCVFPFPFFLFIFLCVCDEKKKKTSLLTSRDSCEISFSKGEKMEDARRGGKGTSVLGRMHVG